MTAPHQRYMLSTLIGWRVEVGYQFRLANKYTADVDSKYTE
jgi:hypothetical protein